MQELKADIWLTPCDARVVTTNGDVNAAGRAVMGCGVALQASTRYPQLALLFGKQLKLHGNRVLVLGKYDGVQLVSFPVKTHWHQRARFDLIQKSAKQLVALVGSEGWESVLVPRPGCGNGGLLWLEVKPWIEKIFDDRFIIVHI